MFPPLTFRRNDVESLVLRFTQASFSPARGSRRLGFFEEKPAQSAEWAGEVAASCSGLREKPQPLHVLWQVSLYDAGLTCQMDENRYRALFCADVVDSK